MSDLALKVLQSSRFTLEVRQDGVLLGAQALAAHEVSMRLGTMLHETEMRLARESRCRAELERRVEELCLLNAQHVEAAREWPAEAERYQAEAAELRACIAELEAGTVKEILRVADESVITNIVSNRPGVNAALLQERAQLAEDLARSVALDLRPEQTFAKLRERLGEEGCVEEPAPEPVPGLRKTSPAERMARSGMFRRRTPETIAARIAERCALTPGQAVTISSYHLQVRMGCPAWAEAHRGLTDAQEGGYIAFSLDEERRGEQVARRQVTITLLRLPSGEVAAPAVPVVKQRTAKQLAADARRRTGTNPTIPLEERLARLVRVCGLVPELPALVTETRLVDGCATNLLSKAVQWLDRMVDAGLLTYSVATSGEWFEITLKPAPEPTTTATKDRDELRWQAPPEGTVPLVPVTGNEVVIDGAKIDALLEVMKPEPVTTRAARVHDGDADNDGDEEEGSEAASSASSGATVLERRERVVAKKPEIHAGIEQYPELVHCYAARWALRLKLGHLGATWSGHQTELSRRVNEARATTLTQMSMLRRTGWVEVESTMATRGADNASTCITVTLLRMPDATRATDDSDAVLKAIRSATGKRAKDRQESSKLPVVAERLRAELGIVGGSGRWEGRQHALFPVIGRAKKMGKPVTRVTLAATLDELQAAGLLRWTGSPVKNGTMDVTLEFGGPVPLRSMSKAETTALNAPLFDLVRQDVGSVHTAVFVSLVQRVCRDAAADVDGIAEAVVKQVWPGMDDDVEGVRVSLERLKEAGHVEFDRIEREGAAELWCVAPRGVRRAS